MTQELTALFDDLQSPGVWRELAVLAAAFALAYLLARLARRAFPKARVWFGETTLDGVLFPLLSLTFTWAGTLWMVKLKYPAALLKVAVPVLVSLVVIRVVARVLHAAFPNAGWANFIEKTVSWVVWLGVVLWVSGLLPNVLAEMEQITWSFGKNKLDLRTIVEGVITASIVIMLALWVSAAIEAKLLSGGVGDLASRKIAANAVRALLLFLGFVFALSAVGIDLTALSVLGGALGVGLGFGLQKLAANYVSGFVILAERSLRIGDNVRVDTFEGQITDIKTRYTLIKALNGREAIVPNEMLITNRVENLSAANPHLLQSTLVMVPYGSDAAAVMHLLRDAAATAERVLQAPAPKVFLSQFARDGLEFTVNYWIDDPDNNQLLARSNVNLALLKALNQAGIEIPYPQRVVRQVT